jgi:hypothetical protein
MKLSKVRTTQEEEKKDRDTTLSLYPVGKHKKTMLSLIAEYSQSLPEELPSHSARHTGAYRE